MQFMVSLFQFMAVGCKLSWLFVEDHVQTLYEVLKKRMVVWEKVIILAEE